MSRPNRNAGPEYRGPDLLYAGGECFTRHGTLVRQTQIPEEDATKETATRNSDARAIGRDGILRDYAVDIPRVEWLGDTDLDQTRNVLPSSQPALFSNEIGAPTVERGAKISALVSLDRIIDDDGAAQEYMENRSDVNADDFAFSIFVAAGENIPTGGNQIVVRDLTASANRIVIKYDFDALGRLIDFEVTTGAASFVAVGGGVYRISSTFNQPTPTSNSGMRVRCQPTQSAALTGDGLYGGAQLEIGTAVTDFQAMPRDPDRKFPSLLLEGAATNLVTESAGFTQGVWTKLRTTVSGNAGTPAPDNTTTADELIEDASAATTHQIRHGITGSLLAGLPISFSVYARAISRDWLNLWVFSSAGTGDRIDAYFNTQTGELGGAAALGDWTLTGSSITDVGDGWFRCSVFGVAGADENVTATIGLADSDGGQVYSGDNTSRLLLWGAQLENAGAPSSYIPTAGTTATRETDAFIAPYPHPPQEMTVLCTWLERGGFTVHNARLFDIGTGASPRLLLRHSDPSNLQVIYGNVTAPVFNVSVPEIVPGALCEAVTVLHGDGSGQITAVAVNGVDLGRESLRGEPLGMAAAWSSPSVNIFGRGTTLDPYNGNALALKIHRGIRSLSFMRAL